MPTNESRLRPTSPRIFSSIRYSEWAAGEGCIPIHLDFGHDPIALSRPGLGTCHRRPRLFCLTHGAGDFMSNYVIEVPAGRKTRPCTTSTKRSSTPSSAMARRPCGCRTARRAASNGDRAPCSRSRSTANIRSSTIQASNRCGSPARTTGRSRSISITTSISSSTIPVRFPIGPGSQNISKGGRSPHLRGFDGQGDQERLGDELRPRPDELALRTRSARQGLVECQLHSADGTMHAHCSQIPTGR